mmetsp:Transcript_37361/g.105420  ORF Transcript_37361/g.105420 Transcript_37361/m.105420 type:complete len:565 (-) Transcript_37361:247-1941(-)
MSTPRAAAATHNLTTSDTSPGEASPSGKKHPWYRQSTTGPDDDKSDEARLARPPQPKISHFHSHFTAPRFSSDGFREPDSVPERRSAPLGSTAMAPDSSTTASHGGGQHVTQHSSQATGAQHYSVCSDLDSVHWMQGFGPAPYSPYAAWPPPPADLSLLRRHSGDGHLNRNPFSARGEELREAASTWRQFPGASRFQSGYPFPDTHIPDEHQDLVGRSDSNSYALPSDTVPQSSAEDQALAHLLEAQRLLLSSKQPATSPDAASMSSAKRLLDLISGAASSLAEDDAGASDDHRSVAREGGEQYRTTSAISDPLRPSTGGYPASCLPPEYMLSADLSFAAAVRNRAYFMALQQHRSDYQRLQAAAHMHSVAGASPMPTAGLSRYRESLTSASSPSARRTDQHPLTRDGSDPAFTVTWSVQSGARQSEGGAYPEHQVRQAASVSTRSPRKRRAASESQNESKHMTCHVCEKIFLLESVKPYLRCRRICAACCYAPICYSKDGKAVKFCQLCSKAHDVADFDPGRRSCREELKKHAQRRREHRRSSATTSTGCSRLSDHSAAEVSE